jgi:hypothetical protein
MKQLQKYSAFNDRPEPDEHGDCYLVSDVAEYGLSVAQFIEMGKLRSRNAELEKALLDARVLMRDLWRLDPGELPSEDLAQRCKAFMGGG